jgi:hypothetical protein
VATVLVIQNIFSTSAILAGEERSPRIRIAPPAMPPRTPLRLSPLLTPSSSLLFRPACVQIRNYAVPQKKPSGNVKKKSARTHFKPVDVSQIDQFSLVDAMRYLRAFEVGYDPVATKYELHVKLRTQKSGPTIKSRIRLPKPVKTDMRICVIAEGKHAEQAKAAGAALVGVEEVFEKVHWTAHPSTGSVRGLILGRSGTARSISTSAFATNRAFPR